MPLIVPDTVQVGIEMSHSGQTLFNVLGFRLDVNSGTRPAIDNLNFVKTAWEATNGPLKRHLNGTIMVGYHYVDLRFADGASLFVSSTATGGPLQNPATLAACAVVKLSAATRSRSEHGRLFHGPLGESEVNDDGRSLNSGSADAFKSAYEQFKAELLTHGLGWAIISRKNSSSKDIASIAVNSVIGTQRRRLS